ncbi:MAG: hypothetical protein ACRERC_26650 [Candidatus Binatia bacterium]
MMPRGAGRSFASVLAAAGLATVATACGNSSGGGGGTTEFGYSTTRLCALVPARDVAAAAFPPTPPVRAFGTDLGFTYERNGVITMLFGDTWQRIDICPIQVNDDSVATLALPPNDWAGFDASQSLPDAECPALTFAVNDAGNAFAPIELHRWDGVAVPLGPLNTPVAAFHDGVREWGVFIVAGGQPCSQSDATTGAPCPSDLSPQAADLSCGFINAQPLCLDTNSTRRGNARLAYYLHFAERVGPAAYVSRAMFLTNKYFNLTARTVRAFDETRAARRNYAPGDGALLMWGRPGFDDQTEEGEAPPYFMHLPLPIQIADGRAIFEPRYLTGVTGARPTFGSSQADAAPLYSGEFDPVDQAAVSWIAPLKRWLMIYGGSTVDFANRNPNAGQSQPVPGALHARLAADPWGTWSEPLPVFTNDQAAGDMVCGKQAVPGCLPPPTPPIRPACLEFVDRAGGGYLYGANIIDSYTRDRSTAAGGPAADVFWNVSTWHPYSVVLIKTRIEGVGR